MKDTQFHILLEVPESFPENLEEILNEINHDKLLIMEVKKPPEAWSSIDDILAGKDSAMEFALSKIEENNVCNAG